MGWPDLTYRSRLEPQLRNELDQLVALVIGWNSAEHGADGQHTTITVDGIQFRRADGSIAGAITVIDGVITITFPPTSPPSVGTGIQIDDVLVATHDPLRPTTMGSGIDLNTDAAPEGPDLAGGRWCLAAAKDGLFSQALVFGNRAGNAAANVSNYVALYYDPNPVTLGGYAFCPPAAGSPALKFKLGSQIDSRLRWDEINGKAINASLGYTERGRPVAQGDWIDVPFNAADYTSNATTTWTVAAGAQVTRAYTLVGTTLTYAVTIGPSSVSAAADAVFLRVALPPGLTAAREIWAGGSCVNNGAREPCSAIVTPGGTHLLFLRETGAVWSASANTTYVQAQLTCSIT